MEVPRGRGAAGTVFLQPGAAFTNTTRRLSTALHPPRRRVQGRSRREAFSHDDLDSIESESKSQPPETNPAEQWAGRGEARRSRTEDEAFAGDSPVIYG